MAQHDPPQHPNDEKQRRNQGQRITAIGQQISNAIRELSGHVSGFYNYVKSKDKKTEGDQDKYQTKSLRYTKNSAIADSILAFLNVLLLGLTLIVLNNQLKGQRLDQRAWIYIATRIEPFVEGEPLKATLRITNAGKTVAKKMVLEYVVQKVPITEAPNLTYSNTDPPSGKFQVNVGVPNSSSPHEIIAYMLSKGVTSLSKIPGLTAGEIEELKSGKSYVVVFARTTYLDIYGTNHWVNSCHFSYHGPGSVDLKTVNCTEYNDMDNN